MPSFYSTSSQVGVDLNNQSSTSLFALGTKVFGTNNTEWIYVETLTAVTANKVVGINATFTCGMQSVADMDAGYTLGFPQIAISASSFAWVALRGENLYVMMTGSSTLIQGVVPICLGGSAVSTGMASMVATSTGTLAGIAISAQGSAGQTATATAYPCIITWPRYFAPSL